MKEKKTNKTKEKNTQGSEFCLQNKQCMMDEAVLGALAILHIFYV